MCQLIEDLVIGEHDIVYLTGRSEKFRAVTKLWLFKNGFPDCPLIMRSNRDWRTPSKYKEAKLKKLLYKNNKAPWLAIDDDYSNDCSEMYRKHGGTHLKVMGDSV